MSYFVVVVSVVVGLFILPEESDVAELGLESLVDLGVVELGGWDLPILGQRLGEQCGGRETVVRANVEVTLPSHRITIREAGGSRLTINGAVGLLFVFTTCRTVLVAHCRQKAIEQGSCRDLICLDSVIVHLIKTATGLIGR